MSVSGSASPTAITESEQTCDDMVAEGIEQISTLDQADAEYPVRMCFIWLECVQRHKRNAMAMAVGFGFIFNLAADDSVHSMLVGEKFLKVVLKTMSRGEEHEALQYHALCLLLRLSITPDAAQELLSSGGMRQIKNALVLHQKHDLAVIKSCELLNQLASVMTDDTREAVTLQVASILEQAAVVHAANPLVTAAISTATQALQPSVPRSLSPELAAPPAAANSDAIARARKLHEKELKALDKQHAADVKRVEREAAEEAERLLKRIRDDRRAKAAASLPATVAAPVPPVIAPTTAVTSAFTLPPAPTSSPPAVAVVAPASPVAVSGASSPTAASSASAVTAAPVPSPPAVPPTPVARPESPKQEKPGLLRKLKSFFTRESAMPDHMVPAYMYNEAVAEKWQFPKSAKLPKAPAGTPTTGPPGDLSDDETYGFATTATADAPISTWKPYLAPSGLPSLTEIDRIGADMGFAAFSRDDLMSLTGDLNITAPAKSLRPGPLQPLTIKPQKLKGKCPNMERARKVFKSLNVASIMCDEKFDKCYCEECFVRSGEKELVQVGRSQRYTLPVGWCRFGMHVDKAFADHHDIFRKWLVSYHGTCGEAVADIMAHHGHLLLPGSVLMSGKVLGIRDGHLPDESAIFTSPTVRYSACDVYATPIVVDTHTSAKVVLQLRQKPGSYDVQPETVRWKHYYGDQRIDDYFPNSEVEWKSKMTLGTIVSGVLIRLYNPDSEVYEI
eukprot:TRINITY_DN1028_c0_g1_i2.p1 TRINITY_DN1028_c0_g1~~TRINITY_DN1028_c0_g1_i2.p1  ORF type:complete len:733 (+),score=155.50 TRINITY_DN1028_c0_g1_i2:141-2339(+)